MAIIIFIAHSTQHTMHSETIGLVCRTEGFTCAVNTGRNSSAMIQYSSIFLCTFANLRVSEKRFSGALSVRDCDLI